MSNASDPSSEPQETRARAETEVRALYQQMLDGWNRRDGDACAAPFADDSTIIGFDGSQHTGRAAFAADLRQIFADHVTPVYVAKVKRLRLLAPDIVMLSAMVGMVPAGQSDLNPALNAHQTIVASSAPDGRWRILHFQTTPAQFHGRPELVREFTDELRQVL